MRSHFHLSMAIVCVALLGGGCSLYEPEGVRRNPETGKEDKGASDVDIFEVTRQVILETYEFASPVKKSNLVMAVTPAEMAGGAKSRKTITVHIKKIYTGAWEPTVRIIQYIEVGEPLMGADPEGRDPSTAMPVASNRWQPLQNLPAEETALRNLILERVASGATEQS